MKKRDFKRTPKKKIHDFVSKYLTIIFLLLIFSFVVLTYHIYQIPTDVESARYFLSALVQSQAAIIAIVISLTLIAVQLTATAYSPRVINIFKNSRGWQVLFAFYGFSLFYGLFVLKMVKGADDLRGF